MDRVLDRFLRELLPEVEGEMRAVMDSGDEDYGLYYGMMHYHLGWVDPSLKPAEANAGKRIRPVICLLVCDAAGDDWRHALPAAAAIELLHNFSLIHDDIQDDSITRRGRETVWRLWGVPQAINAGDSMFTLAFNALCRLADRGVQAEIVLEALRVFTDTCIRLTKGQYLDMRFEAKDDVTVEAYLEMIAGKTAALISASAEIGALVAGAEPTRREHFASFGRNVGLAFQAYDDFLGVWGDEDELGKSTASDIETRKKTLPVLFGLNRSQELRDLYGRPEIGLERAVELLEEHGAREYTLETAQRYSDAAVWHLEKAQPVGPAGEALRSLTTQLIRRHS